MASPPRTITTSNLVLVGGPGSGKTRLAGGIAHACIRGGARGRFFNVVDLVNQLDREARNGRQVRLADHLSRPDFVIFDARRSAPTTKVGAGSQARAICPSPGPSASCCSTSSAGSMSAAR